MPRAQRLTQYDHDGLRFDVTDSGPIKGAIVVLLHGWPSTAKCWDAVSLLLHKAGYRTIAPNQRGYSLGARPIKISAYRMDKLVADIAALISHLGDQPVHLVGHDWGAAVAWSVAATHPTQVTTLTAISVPHTGAFLRAMVSSNQLLRSYYMGVFQVPHLIEFIATRQKKRFQKLLTHNGMTDAQVAAVYRDIIDPGSLTSTINWYRAMLLPSPAELWRKVSVPTMHIWGDQDAALVRKGAELTGQFVKGPYRLEILPGINHWIPEQAPEVLTELLLQSFAQC